MCFDCLCFSYYRVIVLDCTTVYIHVHTVVYHGQPGYFILIFMFYNIIFVFVAVLQKYIFSYTIIIIIECMA